MNQIAHNWKIKFIIFLSVSLDIASTLQADPFSNTLALDKVCIDKSDMVYDCVHTI